MRCDKLSFYAGMQTCDRFIHNSVESACNKYIPPEVCLSGAAETFCYKESALSQGCLPSLTQHTCCVVSDFSVGCHLYLCMFVLYTALCGFVPVVSSVSQGSITGDAFTLSLVESVQSVRVVSRLPAPSAQVTPLIKALQHVLPLCI